MDKFFDDLEGELNNISENIEPVAFRDWENRSCNGFQVRSSSDCWHNKKTLNDDARMVQCDDCGGFLDPYEALKRLVSERERSQRHNRHLREEFKELSAKVYSSKKELKSLDGKIMRRKNNLSIAINEDQLPTLSSFIGVAPNATGDLSTQEFIRNIRDEWK